MAIKLVGTARVKKETTVTVRAMGGSYSATGVGTVGATIANKGPGTRNLVGKFELGDLRVVSPAAKYEIEATIEFLQESGWEKETVVFTGVQDFEFARVFKEATEAGEFRVVICETKDDADRIVGTAFAKGYSCDFFIKPKP